MEKINKGIYIAFGMLLSVLLLLLIMHITDKRLIKNLYQMETMQKEFFQREEILLEQVAELKKKALIDSVQFENKLASLKNVEKKYITIKEQVEKMPLDQSAEFFYSYTSPGNIPNDLKLISEHEVVVEDTTLQNANLIFVDRDYYKEVTDTLNVVVTEAKKIISLKSEIITKQDVILKDHQKALSDAFSTINKQNDEIKDNRRKIRNARLIAIGAVVLEVATVALIFL